MRSRKSQKVGCPLKNTAECFDFAPILMDPEMLHMTEEQMAFAGVSAHQRLYWCSECERVWYETEHHFAHIIGKLASRGSSFLPSTSRTENVYIGD